jgi:hypothetical protein
MIAWRVWFARNKVTHDKPLPSVEGSKRFICNYIQSLENIKCAPVEDIIKGKRPLGAAVPAAGPRPPHDIPWPRPPAGAAKLNIDGAFFAQTGKAGAGMILRSSDGGVIFSACRDLCPCTSAWKRNCRHA